MKSNENTIIPEGKCPQCEAKMVDFNKFYRCDICKIEISKPQTKEEKEKRILVKKFACQNCGRFYNEQHNLCLDCKCTNPLIEVEILVRPEEIENFKEELRIKSRREF